MVEKPGTCHLLQQCTAAFVMVIHLLYAHPRISCVLTTATTTACLDVPTTCQPHLHLQLPRMSQCYPSPAATC